MKMIINRIKYFRQQKLFENFGLDRFIVEVNYENYN